MSGRPEMEAEARRAVISGQPPSRMRARSAPPPAKRLMRAVWRRLPATAASYKLAKGLTRTVLAPERMALVTEVRVAGRFPMRVDLSDIVGNDIYCMDVHYEAPTLALWCALAKTAGTIVDLGSHVGLFACAAAAVNGRARILAVEAFAPNAHLLRANAAQFPNVIPVEVAVAATSGPKTFCVSPHSSGGYVVDDGDPERDRAGTRCTVEAVALAELCRRSALGTIDLMKVDLEGLEAPLLTDQEPFWTEWSPTHLIVEVTMDRGQSAIFTAMERRGYRWTRLESLHAVPWFRRWTLANWHFWRAA